MNRREVILNTAAMAVSASLGAIACGASSATAQRGGGVPPETATALVATALDCQKAGAACLEHCERRAAAGDTSMVECQGAVRDMLAVTEMLAKLAKVGSPHLVGAARLALETCGACEAACRKHADRHAGCRDCAEACARALALYQRVVG